MVYDKMTCEEELRSTFTLITRIKFPIGHKGIILKAWVKGINLYVSDSLNVYKNCSLVVIQILMLVKDQRLQLTKHILNVNHTSRY